MLRDGAGEGLAPVAVPAVVARVRLAEVLGRMLDALPARAAVILDDMQWADAESLELFAHVTQLVRTPLIVVIFRGAGLELGHPLAQRLAEITRQRSCEYVTLESLSRQDAGRLLEQAAGAPLDAQLIDALYERSGGNPFFLGELGRYLLSHADLTDVPDSGRQLPESIRAAVGLRVSGLGAETRRMLQLASVFTAGPARPCPPLSQGVAGYPNDLVEAGSTASIRSTEVDTSLARGLTLTAQPSATRKVHPVQVSIRCRQRATPQHFQHH